MASPRKSTALVRQKRALDVAAAAMPPPPPSKRIKRPAVVLSEDAYLAGLSHVIARDYFPGLLQTEAKQELLDALDSKNEAWIREAGGRLSDVLEGKGPSTPRRGVSLPTRTPASFVGDTPSVAANRMGAEAETAPDAADLEGLSLTAFQAKYTSEDNESFNALVDRQNAKNRTRHTYLWAGNQLPTARQIAHRQEQARLLERAPTSNALELWARDARPAKPNHRAAAPRNGLMFQPDSIEDTHATEAQAAEARSNAPPRAVAPANTRLDQDSHGAPSVPPSPSLSALNDAIAGRPRPSASSEAGWETPRVGGYAFVDAEPTPAERRAHEAAAARAVDAAAIMSSLAADAKAGPSPFSIRDEGRREALHRRLLDRGKHDKKTGPGGSGVTPATPIAAGTPRGAKAGSLTPAARLLFDRMRRDERSSTRERGRADTPLLEATPVARRAKSSALLPGLTPKPAPSRTGD